ncbi:MAG: ferrochelatase [Actinobacteria bacterium]|nr:ferrochelatase [Actinomycetota bacterium]
MSFGGPERPEDLIAFLENVTRGRNVPAERLAEVATQYDSLGGKSPINDQNRSLIAALEVELAANDINLKIYFGNRNWHPLVADTAQQMVDDGVRNALVFVTSAFSSYSGCRQYRDDLVAAAASASAPLALHKLRPFWNHPGFVETMVQRVDEAIGAFDSSSVVDLRVVFSAHSIPTSMAATSDYVDQLHDAARLIMARIDRADVPFDLVFQSRSGPPHVPWLEPDVRGHLRTLAIEGSAAAVALVPLGFLSDHQEVVYDLDIGAREVAESCGLTLIRAATAGTHPRFVTMIRELIEEQLLEGVEPLSLGPFEPRQGSCAVNCCPAPQPRR